MTTTLNLKRLLDRKQWEMCNFAPVATAAGSFITSSSLIDQYQFFVVANTVAYLYDPYEDGWVTLPSPALAGTFGAGSCGTRHPHGPRGFPTAGTTTTMTTGLNLQRSLAGYTCRFIAGPNAGTDAVIKSNTTGAASVVTFQSALGQTITTASEFILITGRVWVVNAGVLAAGSFKYYDLATNTWTNATQTGLPATVGTDSRLIATPSIAATFDTGTATAGAASTLTRGTATWATNAWTNYQIRITAGTGAGQFRTIASNTGTVITVSVAWTTVPDATSVYAIEGNDDNLYYMGSGVVTLLKYSISAGTWSTITPGVARAAAPAAGMSGHWPCNVTDTSWNDVSGVTNFLNGRYIYSFRGGAVTLDRYDIAANTWENDIAYAPKSDTFASGTSYTYNGDYIYVNITNTGRIVKYNIAKQMLEPFTQLFYAQGAIVLGDRFFDVTFTDGATKVVFLYFLSHTQTTLFRIMVF